MTQHGIQWFSHGCHGRTSRSKAQDSASWALQDEKVWVSWLTCCRRSSQLTVLEGWWVSSQKKVSKVSQTSIQVSSQMKSFHIGLDVRHRTHIYIYHIKLDGSNYVPFWLFFRVFEHRQRQTPHWFQRP